MKRKEHETRQIGIGTGARFEDLWLRIVTEVQAAEILQVSTRTLQSWRYRGEGPPYFRMGRLVRYRLSDLAEWLDDQRPADEREGRS